MPKTYQAYKQLFKEYPDVVSVEQMCVMLGGISKKTGYRLLKEKRIESFVIGRTYKVPKLHILEYMNIIQKPDSAKRISS
jgi:excisionase family DNA binding protein